MVPVSIAAETGMGITDASINNKNRRFIKLPMILPFCCTAKKTIPFNLCLKPSCLKGCETFIGIILWGEIESRRG
jgi:hypothetical protein